jgi:hypothetical protein
MNSLASATLLCVGKRVVGRRCAIFVLTRLLGREVRVYEVFPLMAEDFVALVVRLLPTARGW